MRRSSAALLALALLLGATHSVTCGKSQTTSCGPVEPPAPAAAPTAAAAALSNTSYCSLLAARSAGRQKWVSQNGVATNVTLVWGSEPARAAAALLSVLLRHVRLYRGVRLARQPHPHATAALAASVCFDMTGNYTDLIIAVSTAWDQKAARLWKPSSGQHPGLAGPRLAEFGASPVPARRRLHAWLALAARGPACRDQVRRLFYDDCRRTAFVDCDLVDAASRQGPTVDFLAVGDCNDTLRRFEKRARAANTTLKLQHVNTTLKLQHVNRTTFVRTMQTANRSFLFLDYDMWEGTKNVSVVEPPPCEIDDFYCKQELDSTIAMRVADVNILQTYAPQLFHFVHDFNTSLESLRQILEQQASGVDIEEAACKWALETKSYEMKPEYDKEKYYVLLTYICKGDPDNSFFENLPNITVEEAHKELESELWWYVKLQTFEINCADYNSLNEEIHKIILVAGYFRLLGIVSLSVEGAAAASATAAAAHVPLMMADVVPEEGPATNSTWRVAGRPRHIARALRHFVRESGWSRVAVLSQDTKLAADYYAALEDKADIVLRQFRIPRNLSKPQTQSVLQELRDTNARIMFVNADSQAALTILTAAVTGGMGYSDGFVWIVREWRQNNVVCDTKHFAVSFWSRGVEDLPPADGWQALRERLRSKQAPGLPWPPRAVSVVDAILSLLIGFKDVFRQYPETQLDLRNKQVIQLLKESLNETPAVSQRLHYKERSIEETFVFVDQWSGGRFDRRLATWRVNATSGAVRGNSSERASYARPHDLPRDDGASRCAVRSGDPFDPTCHDAECACALLLLALAPGAVLLARRAVRRRLARVRRELQLRAVARRRRVAAVLAAYLVERAALELRDQLGAGRFGSVCLARLRESGRAPRYIAAKALRDNASPAEESEFLREACTIASLEHAHIVRLVGVCIADGPPLVLMELAFFGDLLGYLRERRHLVEGTGSEEPQASGEAEHVSAEALTRLAREAAEALQYLSVRGVVHRDVRAANCLVDERRSLKLADFGMARDTVAGADGAPEYACRRRGLFPVLWMAPESLAHGVFSAASDVWALGVLVLELVTLGERPYGNMSPLRVLEYVAAGGSPPLPLDATPRTRGLARLCWARAAERRPSAAEVAAYLAAWPRALVPALLIVPVEPADADSGFGESPSTELLPPDSHVQSLDQLDNLASTH